MSKRILPVIAALSLLGLNASCNKAEKDAPAAMGSPKVVSADGGTELLPVSYDVEGIYQNLDANGVSKVCKAAGADNTAKALGEIWFGENIFGAELASVIYFEKRLTALDDEEWDKLAEIAADPERYSSALYDNAESLDISAHGKYASRIPENAYYDAMIEEIAEDIIAEKKCTRSDAFRLIYSEGVTIETPYSCDIQAAVDEVYGDISFFSEDTSQAVPQSAFVVMDYDGNVLALAGGNNNNTAYNRAYRIPHKTGSSIKPLSVYTPAVQDNIVNFSSIVSDTPMLDVGTDQSWPRNYNNIYDGDITVTYALRQSKNTVPVRLAEDMGIDRCYDFLRNDLGFDTLTENDRSPSSAALGYLENGVQLTKLCAAYEMFGSGGYVTEPRFYSRVTDADGSVIIENSSVPRSVIDSQTSWIMNRLLYYNICKEDGIAGAASLDDGCEVIGKTGTVDDQYGIDTDRLFVGGTPEYLGAVWMGFDSEGSTIGGIEYTPPTVIWKDVMQRIPRNVKSFAADESVVTADYCTESGGLAGAGCGSVETGYYKPENVPIPCDMH